MADENDDHRYVTFLFSDETQDKAMAMRKIRSILSTMFQIFIQSKDERLNIQQLYYEFLGCLFEYFAVEEDQENGLVPDSETDRRICEIMEYVNHNYNKNISLGHLASRLYLSATYLSKYIKQQLGVNFVELLNRTRLTRAADLLSHTDESIAQIALDVGFSNLSSFNRNFKEKYGMTPSAYRRDCKEKDGESEKEEKKEKFCLLEEEKKEEDQNAGDTPSPCCESDAAVHYEEILLKDQDGVWGFPI